MYNPSEFVTFVSELQNKWQKEIFIEKRLRRNGKSHKYSRNNADKCEAEKEANQESTISLLVKLLKLGKGHRQTAQEMIRYFYGKPGKHDENL